MIASVELRKHMPWYRQHCRNRFEMRVPDRFNTDIVKYLFWANRRGKVFKGKADFIQSLVDKELTAHFEEYDKHWHDVFKPKP